jgi:hypothetical protein
MDVDGRTVSPWLATISDEHSPTISPDGRFIAYVSDETGQAEVYVQPFPGPGAKKLISNQGGREPKWSTDGNELFFRQENQMMVVAVSTEPAFTAGKPRQLFEGSYARLIAGGHSYDVTPDGQRFLMIQREDDRSPPQLCVVVNWFEELKRLVPTQ